MYHLDCTQKLQVFFYFFSLFTHYKHESRSSIYLLVYTIWHPHHFLHYYTRSTLAFTINIYVFIHHQNVSTVDIKRLNKIIIYNLVTLKKQDLYYLLLYLHPISQIPVHDFCKCRPILIIFSLPKRSYQKWHTFYGPPCSSRSRTEIYLCLL